MIPLVTLPPENREHLAKSISWISFRQFLQSPDNRLITCLVRLIKIYRAAYPKHTAGAADADTVNLAGIIN